MFYRLLAINIDGTLLTKSNRIHKSTRDAIKYVQQKGVIVTLVTSRNFSSTKRIASTLQIEAPIVTHRGAYIATIKGEPLFIRRIGEQITLEIVRFLESFSCQIFLLSESAILGNKYKLERSLVGTINLRNNIFEQTRQFVTSISETIINNDFNPLNMKVIFENSSDMNDATTALEKMFSEIQITKIAKDEIEISPQNISKLRGLIYLADNLKITPREIVAIGDSVDDIQMIDSVGLGVAMGNAPYEVKKAADWVTRSNNEHGVAYMVKEQFRKQQPLEFMRKMNIIKE